MSITSGSASPRHCAYPASWSTQLRKAVQAGVKVAFGTDAGVYPHGWNGRQFRHMVEWGQTPLEAIQAATIHAAELLGWQDQIGSLSAGKFADIIAVEGNPLADIELLENGVEFVMKEGRVYRVPEDGRGR